MRTCRFLLVTLAVTVALIVHGCPEAIAGVSKTNEITGSEEFVFPGFSVGAAQAKHRVAYIWSHECSDCREQFGRDVLKIYLSAASKEKFTFVFLEYEEKQKTVDTYTIPALCGGREFYQWYVLGFLANNLTMQQTRELAAKKGTAYKGCPDKLLVGNVLKTYFAKMKKLHPEITTTAGTLVLDGKVISSTREIEEALSD